MVSQWHFICVLWFYHSIVYMHNEIIVAFWMCTIVLLWYFGHLQWYYYGILTFTIAPPQHFRHAPHGFEHVL